MKHLRLFLFAFVALGLAACQTQETAPTADADSPPVRQVSADEARTELQQANDRWLELHNAGDFETLVGMYAADAVVISPEGTLTGRTEIMNQMREQRREGETSSLTTDRIVVAESGDLAYLYGTWTASDGFAGSYVSVMGRENGGWIWLSDSYNVTTMPAE
ncbi:hypothetical protein BH23BAC4_BH23BAC4_12810 [soil metagenome]